mgnify:CR=1 FL=1
MVPGWQQLLIVLVLVLVLFGGRGRISALMGDMAKGIRSFRQGLAEDDSDTDQDTTASATLEGGKDEPVKTHAAEAAKQK